MTACACEQDRLFTTAELAAYARIPAETLKRYRKTGEGPAYSAVGRHRLYRKSDVDAWLRDRLVEPAPAETYRRPRTSRRRRHLRSA